MAQKKVLFTYTIPESVRNAASNPIPAKVTMRPLSADEELQAHDVGKSKFMKSQYDAVKRSLVALDGKPVSYVDGTADTFWEGCGGSVRSLLLQAYNKQTSPTTKEEESFFDSVEIQTD